MIGPVENIQGGNVTYMICGSVEMVKDTYRLLLDNGIEKGRVVTELFTGY